MKMKLDVYTLKQQTQDFVLRLFVESSGVSTTRSFSQYYTCAHAGTHVRLHQQRPYALAARGDGVAYTRAASS